MQASGSRKRPRHTSNPERQDDSKKFNRAQLDSDSEEPSVLLNSSDEHEGDSLVASRCELCMIKLKSKQDRADHWKSHNVMCHHCERGGKDAFITANLRLNSVAQHYRTTHSDIPVDTVCKFCGGDLSLRKHDHDHRVVCPYKKCGAQLRVGDNAILHYRKIHPNVCFHCDKEFKTIDEKICHHNSHIGILRKITCDEPDLQALAELLNGSDSEAEADGSFTKCRLCGAKHMSVEEALVHRKSHMYPCLNCEASLSVLTTNKHYKKYHPDKLDVLSTICHDCGKELSNGKHDHRVQCFVCDTRVKMAVLLPHYRSLHQHVCFHCDGVFENINQKIEHQQTKCWGTTKHRRITGFENQENEGSTGQIESVWCPECANQKVSLKKIRSHWRKCHKTKPFPNMSLQDTGPPANNGKGKGKGKKLSKSQDPPNPPDTSVNCYWRRWIEDCSSDS